MTDNPWLLPDGIEELLPDDANAVEVLRRHLLTLYAAWGYDLVVPPQIEFLESLLTGTGQDLDLQTFKVTDQVSGRTMGIRADMTPQVARIDANRIRSKSPTRLCYIGTVLRARSDGFAASRSPVQVGAELFGHAGYESDIEILRLMLLTVQTAGIQQVSIDLGHVAIYRALVAEAGLNNDQELSLFDMLQRKALPEINQFLSALDIDANCKDSLASLASLNGDVNVLQKAKTVLATAGEQVKHALNYLEQVANAIDKQFPEVEVHIDLAELRGYHYKTGIVFAAFVPGVGQEIARGGRYDDIGKVFGNPRPATGFSADLKCLVNLMPDKPKRAQKIYAPFSNDLSLAEKIEQLRNEGHFVVCALPGDADDPREMGCSQVLRKQSNAWSVEDL